MGEPRYDARVFEPSGSSTVVVGMPRAKARDVYHSLLRASWWWTLAIIVASFLLANLGFAVVYLLSDGIANARPGSLADAFFFSVETMGTVGYGELYPKTPFAHLLMVAEVLCSLLFIATVTGLVFAKFSRPTARILFSRWALVTKMDGGPVLMFRVANARGNLVVAGEFQLVLIRTEKTKEGQTIYRMHDLPLTRPRVPTLTRTYLALHRIEEHSPLYGATPESIVRDEVQLVVALTGIDGTTSQTIYAGHDYLPEEVRFGVRFADMLSELPDGRLRADYTKFHELVPLP